MLRILGTAQHNNPLDSKDLNALQDAYVILGKKIQYVTDNIKKEYDLNFSCRTLYQALGEITYEVNYWTEIVEIDKQIEARQNYLKTLSESDESSIIRNLQMEIIRLTSECNRLTEDYKRIANECERLQSLPKRLEKEENERPPLSYYK